MFALERDQDTICAISTASGQSAIAVVRLSGARADVYARAIVPNLPLDLESHKVYYGHVRDVLSKEIVDEVLVTYFAQGKSFTNENTIEISCHGSQAIVEIVLQNLIMAGARLAQPGEFTYRAFKNGRIDLLQAESILCLIESQSPQAAKQAMRQLKGGLSSEIFKIEENLLWCLSRLEANIDFASEYIEFASTDEIVNKAQEAFERVKKLHSTHQYGKTLNQGFKTVIVGPPNVGKSSLLNRLIEQDRAIVSPLAGTTRDTIEAQVVIHGKNINLVDTAGLRQTESTIEQLGINRTFESVRDADLICYVYDASLGLESSPPPLNLCPPNAALLLIANKADLLTNDAVMCEGIATSTLTGQGLEELRQAIVNHMQDQYVESQTVVIKVRQYELLVKCKDHLAKALHLLTDGISPEFIISEMQVSLLCCFELLGKKFDDEVIDRVFKDFCLGK